MCGQLTPLTHDFHRLLKNIKKLSNNQAIVLDFDDKVTEFDLEIKPSDGYYKSGKFNFNIQTTNYPLEDPRVRCNTRLYHPNISEDESGDVCLSLFDDWTDKNDLEDCVQGLLFLLYNPNLEDPLNPLFDSADENQLQAFEADVKRSLEGAEVEGHYFERNIVEEEQNKDVTGLTVKGFDHGIVTSYDHGNNDGETAKESQRDDSESRHDENTSRLQYNTAVKRNEQSDITAIKSGTNIVNDENDTQSARAQSENKESGTS